MVTIIQRYQSMCVFLTDITEWLESIRAQRNGKKTEECRALAHERLWSFVIFFRKLAASSSPTAPSTSEEPRCGGRNVDPASRSGTKRSVHGGSTSSSKQSRGEERMMNDDEFTRFLFLARIRRRSCSLTRVRVRRSFTASVFEKRKREGGKERRSEGEKDWRREGLKERRSEGVKE